MMAINISKYVG